MRLLRVSILAAFMAILLPQTSMASPCTAPLGMTGPDVPVEVRHGETGYWAYAHFNPTNGQPTITLSQSFYQLPPLMQDFTIVHECCHLGIPTSNEIEANCCALRNFNATDEEFEFLEWFHTTQMGGVGPQYGGNGANFWYQTLNYCGW